MALLSFTALLVVIQLVGGSRNEYSLRIHLLEYYDDVMRDTRPVQNDNDSVAVTHGLVLNAFDFNSEQKLLTAHFWQNMAWTDPGLHWNSSAYGGLTSIRMRRDQIWTPDIMLYNNENVDNVPPADVLLVVTNDGNVLWVPPSVYTVKCSARASDDDEATDNTRWVCPMKFGSWTYDGAGLDLQTNSGNIDTSSVSPNDDWTVTFTRAHRNVLKYDCCPEHYVDVTYKIGLKNAWL